MQNLISFPASSKNPNAQLGAESGLEKSEAVLQGVLDAMPLMALLLNPQRQLVLANRALLDFAAARSIDEVRGLRPGEILECVHSFEVGGCGFTPHCEVCGSYRAITGAQSGKPQKQVCLMVRRGSGGNEPAELEVSAAQVEVSGRPFTLVSYKDAVGQMLLDRLEHAILPQARAVATEIEALAVIASDDITVLDSRREALRSLGSASKRLAGLVRAHSDLADAEAGRLPVSLGRVSARHLLSRAVGDFVGAQALAGPRVELDCPVEDASVETDSALAVRVLREILLNALQATPEGGQVTAGFRVSDSHVEFHINNPGEMARAVQLQIFSRAFSTKAPGRGYGSYFAKLVAERYLSGNLKFRSMAIEGTSFRLCLPRAADADNAIGDVPESNEF